MPSRPLCSPPRSHSSHQGLAEYTGNVVASTTPADAVAFAVRLLTNPQTATVSFVAGFPYRLGAGYGLLLDAAKVQPTADSVAAARRYDGASLRQAEEKRDADQQVRLAELKRRFVDAPVIIMPRARSVALTSTGRTPVPGVGTVFFGGYRLTTEWGRLESTDAILDSIDGTTLRLPAPLRTDGATLSGNGWTITLAPGWVVRPGSRSGDFQVVRESN